MASIFDQASLVIDARNAGVAPGKIFPLKPNVKDLTGDHIPFARNGTALYFDENGVLQTAAANVARRLFVNGTLEGFLFETGVTNVLLYNNDFSNAWWTKNNCTVTSEANAKFGTVWKLNDTVDGSSVIHLLRRDAGITPGTNDTGHKIYAKAGTFSRIRLEATGGAVTSSLSLGAEINLSNGTVVNTNLTGTVTVIHVGDGWYEIEVPVPTNAGNSRYNVILVNNSNSAQYQGDGTGFVYICRAMKVQNGLICGSDIPTTAGTASRVADVASLTGISSLIGQTEGTIYAEVVSRNFNWSGVGRVVALSDGTTNNRLGLARQANNLNRFQGIVSVTGTLTGQVLQGSDVASGGTTKMAMAYRTNDISYYTNGSQSNIDVLSEIPACSRLDLGNQLGVEQFTNGAIKTLAIFTRRISDTELEYITTL